MNVQAVVPTRILRKWDAAAAAQLVAAAALLADENERLERQIGDAWQMIDCERDINRELADRCNAQLGMTIDGDVMVLP